MLTINLTKITRWIIPLLAVSLAGCGMSQRVNEGSQSLWAAIFYQQVKALHLDFTARTALNTDAGESHALSVPVVIRVYQLKDRKTFDKMLYQQLLLEGDRALEDELLSTRDVVVTPGGDANLDMPLEEKTQYVAVVALFRCPDRVHNTWKQVLARADLFPDKPRILTAGENHLTLQPAKDD